MMTLPSSPVAAVQAPAAQPVTSPLVAPHLAPATPTGPVIDVSGGRADPSTGLPDGGPPLGPDERAPEPATFSFDEMLNGLNPLHYVPVVGMIYRAVTGETVPMAERVAVSAVTSLFLGGPLGVLGTLVGCLAEELWKMGSSDAEPQTGTATGTQVAGVSDRVDIMPGSG